jgi:hypothetical protein
MPDLEITNGSGTKPLEETWEQALLDAGWALADEEPPPCDDSRASGETACA